MAEVGCGEAKGGKENRVHITGQIKYMNKNKNPPPNPSTQFAGRGPLANSGRIRCDPALVPSTLWPPVESFVRRGSEEDKWHGGDVPAVLEGEQKCS